MTDEGAARFRRRNAKLQKDGSLNPYRRQDADESDDETADDDESGAQTTGDGSTSRDDSNAPSEQADAAEPMVRRNVLPPLVESPCQRPPPLAPG